MPVLSASDLEQFADRGWCAVRGAFDAAMAAAARGRVWARLREVRNIRADERSTWPDFFNLETHLDEPEILACFSDRLATAIEEVLGPGRWNGRRRWGLWPINFSLWSERPWAVPAHGWHIDGNWFRHTLTSHQQGLLVLGLFSDCGPRGGGTLLAQGSHRATARVLARHPAGLTHRELFDEVLREPIGDFRAVEGAAGDVVLAHPWLFHARGPNHSDAPRFMSNTEAGLRAPMQLDRADGAYSVLERSIRRALAEAPAPAPADAMRCQF